MVLKYIVRDAAWPALWMGVANVIANALVMLRYVDLWREIEMRYEIYADFLQFGHSMGEPEYGGRLHLQPGFVRDWGSRSCSYWGHHMSIPLRSGASNIHMIYHVQSRV
jgi:hypothetical protein